MNEPTLLSLIRQVRAQRRSQPDALEGERLRLEGSLIEFVEEAWPFIDAAPYQPNWAIDALCERLQAVTEGRISRLLINFPPRCGKTIITSVCWIAWTWARRERTFRSGPQVRFLTGSYSHTLALGNANLTRRLILSPFYQRLWGNWFTFRDDQNTKVQVDNSEGGSRLATSVGGTLLGIGGDVLVVDDPHNVAQAESEAERETVSNWWSELSTTRLNDPKQSAIVVIMQRLHEADVSGTILSGDEDWCHLIIPMEYDWRRHCSTSLGWNDPRGLDDDGIPLVENGLPRDAEAAVELDDRNGELMWPERFGAKEVEAAALTFAIPIIAVSIADDTPHLQRARYQADANFALECMVTLCLAGSEAELEFCGSITDDSDRRDYQMARDYLARQSPTRCRPRAHSRATGAKS
jgi:hypothetical protein